MRRWLLRAVVGAALIAAGAVGSFYWGRQSKTELPRRISLPAPTPSASPSTDMSSRCAEAQDGLRDLLKRMDGVVNRTGRRTDTSNTAEEHASAFRDGAGDMAVLEVEAKETDFVLKGQGTARALLIEAIGKMASAYEHLSASWSEENQALGIEGQTEFTQSFKLRNRAERVLGGVTCFGVG